MADLTETPVWEPGIYQIEPTDPVVGGVPDLATKQGVTNIPAKQLADRTAWLKAQLEALQALVAGYEGPDPFPAYLTDAEGDGKYVLQSALTGAALLNLIKQVHGSGSGLDADKLDGLQASAFARTDVDTTLMGMLISQRIGHEKIRLVGALNDNPLISLYGSEGRRGLLQAYDDHMALRVYKPDETLISLRIYDDGRITWNGKKLLTEEDKSPDRIDTFPTFPTSNSSVSVLHGYGKVPSRFEAWAVCNTANNGFPLGFRVKLSSNYRYHIGGTTVGCSDTELSLSTMWTEISNKAGTGSMSVNSSDWGLEFLSWM